MNKIITNILHIGFFSCFAATKLISQMLDDSDSQTTLLDKFKLYVHLISCDGCRHFKSQLNELHQVFQSSSAEFTQEHLQLDETVKERINTEIASKIEK